MHWANVILLVLLSLRVARWLTDSDDRSESRSSSAPDPNAEPSSGEARSNRERALPIASTEPDPLWDRQLDG
jgi:hypothetical protein